MATVLRAQVNLINDTALPRDVAMNTWHFASPGVDINGDAEVLTTALIDFYGAIDAYFSSETTAPGNIKWYNLLDVAPRVPFREEPLTYSPGSADSLPNEVAVCLSYSGAIVSGENPRRRRGRIFLGPFTVGALSSGTGDSRVLSVLRGLIAGAAEALVNDSSANLTPWIVFSPTTAGPEPWGEAALESGSIVITQGYIDDAFDTVRSRGLPPTARTNWQD